MSAQGKILIIDDSETLLSRVQMRLAAEGYEVVTSTQSIGNARHLHSTDLVLIDFHMPGFDGAHVVDSLRRAAGDRSACLLYLYTSDEGVAAAYEALGFDGVFTQKGDLDALAGQVRAASSARGASATRAAPRRAVVRGGADDA